MNSMKYKSYTARIEYSDDDECFVGHIAGIKDIIGFHGNSVSELKEAFIEAVDDYIECCAAIGKLSQSYSGNLMLRIVPEVHAAVATAAQVSGKSINQWAAEVLYKEARF
jgi:predicted HicB family RNase H-like nuclease